MISMAWHFSLVSNDFFAIYLFDLWSNMPKITFKSWRYCCCLITKTENRCRNSQIDTNRKWLEEKIKNAWCNTKFDRSYFSFRFVHATFNSPHLWRLVLTFECAQYDNGNKITLRQRGHRSLEVRKHALFLLWMKSAQFETRQAVNETALW